MNPTTSPQSPPLSYTPAGQTGAQIPTGPISSQGNGAGGLSSGPQNAGTALQNLPQRAREAAQHTREVVQEKYQQVRANAEQGLAASETYVKDHPLSTVLGAFAVGALVGLAIGLSRREESLRDRLSEHPLQVIRDAVVTALTPTAERLHDSYDQARDSASKAFDRASRSTARCTDSWLHSLSRAGNSLKFW